MNISLDKVKKLRAETLAGIIDCKKALEESKGDIEEAKKILRKKGVQLARKKSGEATTQGLIASYIHHNGRVGALVEIRCQSDFVAKNDEFQKFARNIAMHIAASNPKWISLEGYHYLSVALVFINVVGYQIQTFNGSMLAMYVK